jgi:hypothetical protein
MQFRPYETLKQLVLLGQGVTLPNDTSSKARSQRQKSDLFTLFKSIRSKSKTFDKLKLPTVLGQI